MGKIGTRRILLVEPEFPILAKSKNHKNFLPIGLLKIASYLRSKGIKIKLVRGTPESLIGIAKIKKFKPNEIWVTSLFTYWAKYVRDAVQFYKEIFPDAKVIVGGIYASLFSKKEVKKYTGCDKVYQGTKSKTEKFLPAYDLLENANPHPIDYQITHASRGCERRCKFCGTWIIEPKFKSKKSVKNEIKFKKVVFYDNNILMNKFIEDILEELKELRKEKKIEWVEAQSGFDGRILTEKPYLGKMIKEAGFRYPRIAWDWKFSEYLKIETQINILINAGYHSKEIYVFMLYNWDISFDEMEKKRIKCWKWKVQIADCRYRPLDQLFDNYNSHKKGQSIDDYFIHEKWSDSEVKQFRKNVRRQNICIRHGFPFYSKDFERKNFNNKIMKLTKGLKTKREKVKYLKEKGINYWFPNKITYPNNCPGWVQAGVRLKTEI